MIYDKKSSERTLICPTEIFSVFIDFVTLTLLTEYFGVFFIGNGNQRAAVSLQPLYSCAHLGYMINSDWQMIVLDISGRTVVYCKIRNHFK